MKLNLASILILLSVTSTAQIGSAQVSPAPEDATISDFYGTYRLVGGDKDQFGKRFAIVPGPSADSVGTLLLDFEKTSPWIHADINQGRITDKKGWEKCHDFLGLPGACPPIYRKQTHRNWIRGNELKFQQDDIELTLGVFQSIDRETTTITLNPDHGIHIKNVTSYSANVKESDYALEK